MCEWWARSCLRFWDIRDLRLQVFLVLGGGAAGVAAADALRQELAQRSGGLRAGGHWEGVVDVCFAQDVAKIGVIAPHLRLYAYGRRLQLQHLIETTKVQNRVQYLEHFDERASSIHSLVRLRMQALGEASHIVPASKGVIRIEVDTFDTRMCASSRALEPWIPLAQAPSACRSTPSKTRRVDGLAWIALAPSVGLAPSYLAATRAWRLSCRAGACGAVVASARGMVP